VLISFFVLASGWDSDIVFPMGRLFGGILKQQLAARFVRRKRIGGERRNTGQNARLQPPEP